MTRGQQHELIAPNGKGRVGLHEQPADPLIDDGGEGRVNLAIGAHVEDAHLLLSLSDAACTARSSESVCALVGLINMATSEAEGASSRSSSCRLGVSMSAKMLMPVRLDVGRRKW